MTGEHGSTGTPPASDANAIANDAAEPIVSVNDRGRRGGGKLGPFFAMAGIALVILIGGLATVNVVRAKLSGPKPAPQSSSAENASLARTFNTDGAPPLPGASNAPLGAAGKPACADGSAGNELKGEDGIVVRNREGKSIRVCPDGQVAGVTQSSEGGVQPIPVVSNRPAQPSYATRAADTGAAPRPSDGPTMLNGGQYGGAPILAALTNPQGALETVKQGTEGARPKTEGLLTTPGPGSLEAELTPSKTPMVQAARLDNLNLLLPKGRTIDCGMSMRTNSALAGQASCVVTSNVYSANGKVLLIERGSEAVGEYRSGVSIGQRRLFVLWTRIITPAGVVINLDSPGADELGSTGLTGKVDNHWFERIGSAFLLSTIQDAIQFEIAEQRARSGGTTLVFGNTAQAGNQMAQRVLETTINIPPTIFKTQGDRAVIYVARDLDFSNVYRLRARP